ncbi:hypothetical protein GHK80_29195 [Sinorhizobium medicae]|nr:hypothetical protein [Sinorhizobium medicae]
MLPTKIKVGHVFRYSYFRHWQHLEGREEGDKGRPCLVLALVTTLEDGTLVRGRPINHTRWPAPEPSIGPTSVLIAERPQDRHFLCSRCSRQLSIEGRQRK